MRLSTLSVHLRFARGMLFRFGPMLPDLHFLMRLRRRAQHTARNLNGRVV
jgi:hypothetical protein